MTPKGLSCDIKISTSFMPLFVWSMFVSIGLIYFQWVPCDWRPGKHAVFVNKHPGSFITTGYNQRGMDKSICTICFFGGAMFFMPNLMWKI